LRHINADVSGLDQHRDAIRGNVPEHKTMRAKDIMKTNVVTVGPKATVGEVAALMYKRGISGIPVVEDGKIVGLVSEGDLIRRQEIGSATGPRSWWLAIFGRENLARDYVLSHARQVGDIMTRDVVTVGEEAPLAEIAALFASRHIKRVPVVRDGQLVGLVSRANLIQALAGAALRRHDEAPATDREIRDAVLAELDRQSWWDGWLNNATVEKGVVHLWGFYIAEDDRNAARVAAENIPGVRDVQDHRMPRAAFTAAV
jgi:CBS domain-containing protein